MASSSSPPLPSTHVIKPIRKRRFNSPNDHIITLVKDWYNDARANGAQTVHCYKKVLASKSMIILEH